MKKSIYLFIIWVYFLPVNITLAEEYQQSSVGASDDCTDISVDFKASSNLTQKERIALMDEALTLSLNKYERCQNTERISTLNKSSAKSASSEGEGNQAIASKASAMMTGTEPAAEQQERKGSEQKTENKTPTIKGETGTDSNDKVLGNGKVPDDIPPVNNDSILEEQIRRAAMNETDPVIKEKLWNEYRRYKGLPAVQQTKKQ
ncbi:MAG: hypothetical protein Q9M22_03325 [Mariprofundaceae bacterium]|nr:hypothetical protein [Mariprofundaceae bacterium]